MCWPGGRYGHWWEPSDSPADSRRRPAQQLTTPAPSTAPLAPGRPVTAPTTSGPAGGRIMPGPDYRLGPGDTLEVQIAGRLDIDRFQVVVDPTGAISVPPLGSIQVG